MCEICPRLPEISHNPTPPPVSPAVAVAVAAVGLAFAASAVGFAFAACSVRVAVAAVTIRRTHSLHICKFFLMYTAVQPPAISGRPTQGIDALAEAPVHLPALAAVLFKWPALSSNPGAAEPIS